MEYLVCLNLSMCDCLLLHLCIYKSYQIVYIISGESHFVAILIINAKAIANLNSR